MRPWRLTRRQRVEMEYALGRIRGDVGRHRAMYLGGVMAGWSLLSGRPSGEAWSALREIEGGPGIHRVRARVAIALRAALRADEDARCEEAALRIGDAYGYDAECAIGEMREWPAMAWVRRVPLALWERT